jgi:hypothetical protein
MTDLPLCLGLHITKCAGTSLMTTLRRALSEDEYYFFSSYHENWLASRPLFAGLRSPERLRIVMGHYCHESLLSVFAHRPVFLFTGLREPVSRAISGYRQVSAVCAQAGRPPPSAASYLSAHRDPICTEILRAFPSLSGGPAPLWEKARAALSLFDLVTDTDGFSDQARAILAVIDGPARAIVNDNVSDEKRLPPEMERVVRAETALLAAQTETHLADDLRLYRVMAPLLGQPDLRARLAGEAWALDRAAFVAGLPPPDMARAAFAAREADFMLAEFAELGRLPELRAWLQARATEAAALARRIVVPSAG